MKTHIEVVSHHWKKLQGCMTCISTNPELFSSSVSYDQSSVVNVLVISGLCNGTRLVVTKLGKHMLEAKVITRKAMGDKVYIPRIPLSLSDTTMSFNF
ncbi:unnamed protein product [Cuscuta epithymum]|uniref:Uncharacterized protein n=1 Tax=Cuscuta epithymum TaxID=186058 RepID=A0AAV0CIZ4_9ASTE|nr:unnamed protein product [Cuscuta epithymum]